MEANAKADNGQKCVATMLLYKYTLWKTTRTASPPCCLSQADGPGHVFNIMLVIWPVAADRKNWDFYLKTTTEKK